MLAAAADLSQTYGLEAVSTRAVAAAAGVQPPAINRQFGDKDGLLDAVIRYLLQRYIAEKRLVIGAEDDPAVELRQLWDLHVKFGLTYPDCFALAYGQARPSRTLTVEKEAISLLRTIIWRPGDQGRLRLSIERAVVAFRSIGTGYIMTQIAPSGGT